jgi:5-formyltetrahydrofolate cyclo-ligase
LTGFRFEVKEASKMNREEIRRQMLALRGQLSPGEAARRGARITRKLSRLIALDSPKTIMVFCAMKNEVELSSWADGYREAGFTILLPRIEGETIQPVRYSENTPLVKSSLGVLEPEGGPYPLEKIDYIIVPGLAFDRHGFRLGYGKGYYDRFLPQCEPQTQIWGVAYRFQRVEDIGPHRQDWPVQRVITD